MIERWARHQPFTCWKGCAVVLFLWLALGTHGIMEDDLDVLISALTSFDFKESQVQILRASEQPHFDGTWTECQEIYSVQ